MTNFAEFGDADQWPLILTGGTPPDDYPTGLPFVPNAYVRYKRLSKISVAAWTLGTPERNDITPGTRISGPVREDGSKLGELLETILRVLTSLQGSQVTNDEVTDFVNKLVDIARAGGWQLQGSKNSIPPRKDVHIVRMERGKERLDIVGHGFTKIPSVTAIYRATQDV